jgi:hypothetical protein
MSILKPFAASFAILFLFGCWDTTPGTDPKYDTIAAQFCACTQQLAALNQKMQTPSGDSVNMTAFQAQLQDIETAFIESRDCVTDIIREYGPVKDTAVFTIIQKKLQAKCPEMATQRDLLQELLGE